MIINMEYYLYIHSRDNIILFNKNLIKKHLSKYFIFNLNN